MTRLRGGGHRLRCEPGREIVGDRRCWRRAYTIGYSKRPEAMPLEKLVQGGEFDTVARRHAGRYLNLFEGAEAEAETRPTNEWLADYVPGMDNLRAALDWAFSPGGDATVGVALT